MLSCRWRVWTEDGIGQLRTITNKVASFCGGIGFEMGIKLIRKLFMNGRKDTGLAGEIRMGRDF